MRVCVTGGAGFIGANTVRALLATDAVDRVVVVDDFSTGAAANLEGLDRVDVHEGSILDARTLDAAMVGVAAVVHLAARPSVPRSLADPVASNEVNVTGTVAVLEAARRAGMPHVVAASSSSVYGANPALPKHEDLATVPLSPYAVSKLATEGYALAYQASFGLPVLAFRFFNVFGPHQSAGHAYAAAIPAFIDAALRGRPVTVHGDGLQSRDFTYVGSLSAVLVKAVLRRVTSPGPVNLAFGSRATLLDVVALLGRLLGREIPVVHEALRPGDVRHSQADQTRLRSLFPTVAPVALEDGLAATVEWFRAAQV